jgi:hypothetical protein
VYGRVSRRLADSLWEQPPRLKTDTPRFPRDSVERSLNVQTPQRSDHNPANLTLLEGSRQLGYACKSVPQNISGSFADHARCGANCTIGCRGFLDGEGKKGKMSGCRVFLQPRLKASRDGGSNILVRGLDGFEIDRIVFSEPNDASGLLGLVPGTANRRAIGAVGTLQDPETGIKERLLVLADRTVVSAGTLNSPVILLRSGLKVGASLFAALRPLLMTELTLLLVVPGRTPTSARTFTSTRPSSSTLDGRTR